MTMTIRTHKYAELAYPLVNDIKKSEIEAKYRTLALTFPTMIMQSGLAQALGFLMAKGNKEHITYLEHLAVLLNQADYGQMYSDILKADITKYQRLTLNALEASSWLKRYTQAFLEKSSGDHSPKEQ